MRIICYPIIPVQTCDCCHTNVSINTKDLRWNASTCQNDAWKCPVCSKLNEVKWSVFDWRSGENIDVFELRKRAERMAKILSEAVNEQKQNDKKVGNNK